MAVLALVFFVHFFCNDKKSNIDLVQRSKLSSKK